MTTYLEIARFNVDYRLSTIHKPIGPGQYGQLLCPMSGTCNEGAFSLSRQWVISLVHGKCSCNLELNIFKLIFLAATKQLYEGYCWSLRPSVHSVHSSVTPFSQFSYHHVIIKFSGVITLIKWCPCKRSRSEVKDEGHRCQNKFPDDNCCLNSEMVLNNAQSLK